MQLPNWIEAVVLFHATLIVGDVYLPMVPIYGPHEVGFILSQSGAKVFFTADRWKKHHYLEHITRLPALPGLRAIIVIGDEVPSSTINWADFIERQAPLGQSPAHADDDRRGGSSAIAVYWVIGV